VTSIWWERPSCARDLDTRASLLSADERVRIERLHRASDRANAVAAWTLVRLTLGAASGTDPRRLCFERACETCGRVGHGKPRLCAGDGSWHFSLSHSGDLVVVAVSPLGPLGVDVESTSRVIDELQSLVQHPSEPQTSGVELLRVWTRKEAVLKATGEGLARAMSDLDLGAPRLGFALYDLACPSGYVGAVATLDGPPEVSPWRC
jgi:4'-phosphopantetheinyl transferase